MWVGRNKHWFLPVNEPPTLFMGEYVNFLTSVTGHYLMPCPFLEPVSSTNIHILNYIYAYIFILRPLSNFLVLSSCCMPSLKSFFKCVKSACWCMTILLYLIDMAEILSKKEIGDRAIYYIHYDDCEYQIITYYLTYAKCMSSSYKQFCICRPVHPSVLAFAHCTWYIDKCRY